MCIFFKGRQCSGLPFAETCVPYLYETTAWMDCEPVRVLGTFAPTSSDCFRGQRSATGASQLVKVPRPTVSAAYNQGVGGTGQIDQLVHYCDDRYRTHKWGMRIYLHILSCRCCERQCPVSLLSWQRNQDLIAR